MALPSPLRFVCAAACVTSAGGVFASHSAFAAKMALTPVFISGFETNGKTGTSWVDSNGNLTAALIAEHANAAPVPTVAAINEYVPAGTRHYGAFH